jgi:hypothetical protein
MDDDILKEVDNLRALIKKQETSLYRFFTERRRALNRLHKMGLPWPMIAREVGVTTQTAMRWAGKFVRRDRYRGEEAEK